MMLWLWLKWALTPEERIIQRIIRLSALEHVVEGVDLKGEHSCVRLLCLMNVYGVCYYQIIDESNQTLWTGRFWENLSEDDAIIFDNRYSFKNKEFITARCALEMESFKMEYFKLLTDTKYTRWQHLKDIYTTDQLSWILRWKD